MDGAIRLVERQGGVVAGIAAVCIEENDVTARYRAQYKCATAVLPGTDYQAQCNAKTMAHFEAFDQSGYFPELPPD